MAEKDVFREVMGPAEAATEGVREGVAAFGRGAGAVWDFVTGGPGLLDFGHGATEVMNLIYGGSAFTPYGWAKVEPGQGVEAPRTPELGGLHGPASPEMEQDHGIEL